MIMSLQQEMAHLLGLLVVPALVLAVGLAAQRLPLETDFPVDQTYSPPFILHGWV